jgi:hypothetical protein
MVVFGAPVSLEDGAFRAYLPWRTLTVPYTR